MAYVGRKSGRAALISADIPSNLNLLGDYVKIPSATTTERDALTPVVGMMLYNTTLGIMQQYNATGWASIDSPPTVSSFTYPDSGTALDVAGSTTATLVITGTNFQTGVTVAIDGTAPTATTKNSSTQITITGFPAKSAATYTNGLVVTNPTGLAASVDIAYDAVPAWTTAAGSLGSFIDGAFTNSSASTIRIVAAEGSDTIDYAQVSDAGGDTVITSGVAGLTLGTTGANAGYLTGTLAGSEGTTYTFYAKAQDDENQFSAVRSFNIISSYAATGGTTINTNDWVSNYKIHVFNIADTGTSFVANISLSCDILVVAGGGGGGNNFSNTTSTASGGGGGGGLVYATGVALSGSYLITVGAGGSEGAGVASQTIPPGGNNTGSNGGNSIVAGIITALGGGGGAGSYSNTAAGTGGSGGGGAYSTNTGAAATSYSGTGTGYGYLGGNASGESTPYASGGGGGAGGAGTTATGGSGGAGGAGRSYVSNFSTNVGGASGVFSGGGGGGVGGSGTSGGRGSGGSGGGGNSGYDTTDAVDAVASTGGGGGGSGKGGTHGGDGGSGIVIIRYAV
jgi:hypothetical protein